MSTLWEIVGGADKGGILVREGKDLKSPQAEERLSTGATVEQLAFEGERLRYRLVEGTGPLEGWISVEVSGKDLAVPKAAPWPTRHEEALSAAPTASTIKAAAPWVKAVGKPPAQARLRLLCFNWTGNRGGAGSSHTFSKWPKLLGDASPADTWEVCEVSYPGRQSRMKEPSATVAREIAVAVAEALGAAGPPAAMVFFGFSFGSVLAYETAVLLSARGAPPLGLVVASAEQPGWPGRATGVGPNGGATKELSDKAFEEVLRKKGGTDMILNSEEMKQMFVPVIRADMLMEELYGSTPPTHKPLSCPIVAFRGAACPIVPRDLVDPWLDLTSFKDAPTRVEELETGLSPADGAAWLCDWYLCQSEKSVAGMIAALARDFGGGA